MKPYMAFSRGAGPGEGAVLVIANTARQAKSLVWRHCSCWNVDDWLDQAVRLIRNNEDILALADQEKLRANVPHVIDSPEECEKCEWWGVPLSESGLCESCSEWAETR
ncbi:hypothetical protein LCGC14_0835980 [marine sediment metagenome]|uniref:Uncharacterized protein n=1 Tax=marine sediment metagenome TaxID=412755 RepID=A0A0F9SLT9_9ZZZZ